MNAKELKSKKLYKEYSLEIPFEDIDKEINLKIKNLIPSVSIPGFRKGKAPISIVRKKYEDSVLNEVIQSLVNDKTSELIKKNKYKLFRQPRVDLKKFEKNKPVIVDIKLDLQPEIELLDFKQIKINKYEITFSKKETDENYKKFIDTQKKFKKIDSKREVLKKDKVTINFETNNTDVPEFLKAQKNIPVDTSIEQEILPGINYILTSNHLKQGDIKNFNFDLSKQLKDKKFKKISYTIEVISIEEIVKFEIDDTYLKNNGFKNENELKDLLKNNTIQQYNQGIKQIEKKQIMDLLNKEYEFDLPEGVLEEDFNEIMNRISNAKKDGTLDEDDKSLSDKQLKDRYKKISERRVKLGVLLQFIAREKNINVSEEEISQGIMQYASQYPGQEKQIVEYLQKNPSSVESIRGPLLEDKIINTITSSASVTNKKINQDQYKKLEEQTFDINRSKL